MTSGVTVVDFSLMMTPEMVSALTPPCELGQYTVFPESSCDNPAAWVMHRSCCGSNALACTACKDRRLANVMAVMCPSCGTTFFDSTDAYRLIEAI